MPELVTLHVFNQNDDPLEGCQCYIYGEDGVLVTTAETDEVGRAEVLLPSSPNLGIFYFVRLYLAGCSFDSKYGISVIDDDDNVFEIAGIQHFFAPATDPSLCAIHYEPIFQAGSVADIAIHILPTDIRTTGTTILSTSYRVSLDRKSNFLLPRDSWHFTTLQNETRVCHVPNSAACHLVDFVYPTIKEVTVTGDIQSIICDTYPKHVTFPISVARTDGCILPDYKNTLKVQDYLSISSSDESVCTVRITDTSIDFVCKKAGSATILIDTLPEIKKAYVGRDYSLTIQVTVSDA